jgi:hypothetical protein
MQMPKMAKSLTNCRHSQVNRIACHNVCFAARQIRICFEAMIERWTEATGKNEGHCLLRDNIIRHRSTSSLHEHARLHRVRGFSNLSLTNYSSAPDRIKEWWLTVPEYETFLVEVSRPDYSGSWMKRLWRAKRSCGGRYHPEHQVAIRRGQDKRKLLIDF